MDIDGRIERDVRVGAATFTLSGKSGGKLLMAYGWADQILQPKMGVKYYEEVVAKNGRNATDFVRLFMMPGVMHCGGGAGPTAVNEVTTDVRRNVSGLPHRLCPTSPLLLFQTIKVSILLPARFA